LSPVSGRPSRIAVLGAAGLVGRWAVRHLPRDTDKVVTIDLAGDVDYLADVCALEAGPRAVVAGVDVVVLALPEVTALRCLDWLSATIREETVVLSTCSVQGPVFARSDKLGMTQLVLGVNPMFSPTLPSAGRPVALITRKSGSEAEHLRKRLEDAGMVVSVMDPDAHDSAMSYLQTLPHAAVLGLLGVLAECPVDTETLMRLAPPPARMLIALACRILTAPAEIYWDIQRANPEGVQRRRDLCASIERLDAMVTEGREDDFRATLAATSDRLGPFVAVGADECQKLFGHLPPSFQLRVAQESKEK
jgi:prephenate dehydrogenase